MMISFLFRMFAVSFIFILLINFGYCVITPKEIDQIRNEMRSSGKKKSPFHELTRIVMENDENDLKTVRELVNEMLSSDDMVTKSNALMFCSLMQNKLNNHEECTKAFIEFIKDERYKESQYGIMPIMSCFRFSDDDIGDLLEMSPAIKARLGYQSWKEYMGAIAVSAGEKAYDPIIKLYNLDNATTDTLLQYDWLLIKTGDMRSINRIFQKVESMPLDSKDYTRELGGLIGNVFRNARKEKSEENMRLYNRCLKLMDKITSNESSYPEYVRIVCSSFSDMLVVNPENRKFALQKLEELRPVWKDTYYAKDIEYEIKKALREEGKQDK